MIILWLDPWTATTGFAVLEKEGKTVRILEYGVITTRPGVAFSDRLVTNGIDVAQARGVLVYNLAIRGIPLVEFTPLQVKQGIAGNGFAKKPQVQKALKMVLGLSEIPKPDDAADALAIAYLTSLKYTRT